MVANLNSSEFHSERGKIPEEVTEKYFMNIKDNRFTRYNRFLFMK